MKKIIDGKIYNTETATELAMWDNSCSYTDFHFVTEGLYRTPNGRYFLHGRGGSASVYSVSVGQNSSIGGEKIIPMTEMEAMEWVEEKVNDKYIEIFGKDSVQEA